jgi:branched-chain amino acid transport system substrate-binding protein
LDVSTTSAAGKPTGPIIIGASLSLTGTAANDFSADGQAFEKGYELWAKDVNAHGGILGRRVKLVILNDDSSPETAVTNYQTLIGSDHVDLTFGPFSSVLSAPASTVAARYGMAFVEGAGGAPSVFDTPSNQADHNVFDVSLPVADELVPFVQWIASLPSSERPKTAAFPMAEDPFADRAERAGGPAGLLPGLPRAGLGLQSAGRPGGQPQARSRGARFHRRADGPGLYAAIRARALHT